MTFYGVKRSLRCRNRHGCLYWANDTEPDCQPVPVHHGHRLAMRAVCAVRPQGPDRAHESTPGGHETDARKARLRPRGQRRVSGTLGRRARAVAAAGEAWRLAFLRPDYAIDAGDFRARDSAFLGRIELLDLERTLDSAHHTLDDSPATLELDQHKAARL